MNRKKTIVDTTACTCNECNPNATTPLPVEQINRLADSYRDILLNMGEDPEREGLLKTPMRAAKAIDFLTHGYRQNPRAILESALFHEDYKQIVIVKDIEIYSLCEHHLLPFFGKAHIGYIPNGKIVGLSKIPRVVGCFARRLLLHDPATTEIKDCLQDVLQPIGVAVVIEAQHLCMSMRGIQKQNSVTTSRNTACPTRPCARRCSAPVRRVRRRTRRGSTKSLRSARRWRRRERGFLYLLAW